MRPAIRVIDPLWQCLCPAWSQIGDREALRLFRATARCVQRAQNPAAPRTLQQRLYSQDAHIARSTGPNPSDPNQSQTATIRLDTQNNDVRVLPFEIRTPERPKFIRTNQPQLTVSARFEQDVGRLDTLQLYRRLMLISARGRCIKTRWLVEYLVRERRERPNLQLYNALILSNTDAVEGSAWRVNDLLEEMEKEGLQPDSATCHAVLKVLSVHLDHLLRADILRYMHSKWIQLTNDGAHDVAAGLFRDRLFEQALEQLAKMSANGVQVERWLLDLAVFALCEAGEIEEAYRIMKFRDASDERDISLGVWHTLLDKASEARHHAATTLVWTSQVNQDYINPASGLCFNVLATASRAGDAALGTEVFARLSKRGTAFQRVHFELLIAAYLNASPPDLRRAINVLTIMTLEGLEPAVAETRSLYTYIHDKPALVQESLAIVKDLHYQGRKIPIALLNLLIECHVEQKNLDEAMKIYKMIHTFAPIEEGPQKTFADIETFNLLLKGCRTTSPPDAKQAAFLISELLALRMTPSALTYDRLILVLVMSASAARTEVRGTDKSHTDPKLMLDWSYRHFMDMQSQGWMPRFGTIEKLCIELAGMGDARCWDVLQAASDRGKDIDGYMRKQHHLHRAVESAWGRSQETSELQNGPDSRIKSRMDARVGTN